MNQFRHKLELVLEGLSEDVENRIKNQLLVIHKEFPELPRYLFFFDYRDYSITSIESNLGVLRGNWTLTNSEFQMLSENTDSDYTKTEITAVYDFLCSCFRKALPQENFPPCFIQFEWVSSQWTEIQTGEVSASLPEIRS